MSKQNLDCVNALVIEQFHPKNNYNKFSFWRCFGDLNISLIPIYKYIIIPVIKISLDLSFDLMHCDLK